MQLQTTLVIFCATIVALIFSAQSSLIGSPIYPPRHNTNLTIGYPGVYDKLLFQRNYTKTGSWWRERTKYIKYPEHAPGTIRNETITAIRVTNLAPNAYARNKTEAAILQGGIGYKNVTIGLYSKATNVGINYMVQIWGRKY